MQFYSCTSYIFLGIKVTFRFLKWYCIFFIALVDPARHSLQKGLRKYKIIENIIASIRRVPRSAI